MPSIAFELRRPPRAAPARPGWRYFSPAHGARGDGAVIVDPWKDLATVRAPVRLGSEVFASGRLALASIGQARRRAA